MLFVSGIDVRVFLNILECFNLQNEMCDRMCWVSIDRLYEGLKEDRRGNEIGVTSKI